MASRSLRRSRAVESEDDTSRPSTPASTAPNDGKRVRRSFTDDHDVRSPESTTIRPRPMPPRDVKVPLTNGLSVQKPTHQPGAIIRVKLKNFVTYTAAEFFPGPNLNMVIGPNGTGKSTLVCAICLGLGWGTQYLGRAKDAAEFVKHGCREATIEIELQRSRSGPNMSRSNPVITRTIKREANKSTYTLNGETASARAVMQLARSYDIQIDNLCQFLPQDKVVEFAQMTPIEILQSTQSAAAPPHMLDWHQNLKELRKAQKESNDNKKNDRDALVNLENRQEMQRTEVERLRERVIVQKRLTLLQKCRPLPQFSEARLKAKDAKQRHKEITAEHKQLEEESEPALEKVEAKRVYAQRVREHKIQQEKELRAAEKECERLARIIDTHDIAMKDCDQIEASEINTQKPSREDIARTRVRIATLQKQKEQAPEPFDSRAMNQQIQDHVNRTREIESRLDEVKNKVMELKEQGKSRANRGKQLQASLEALSTVTGRQEELLKARSSDSYRAWDWIKKNQDMFRKPVYGPPMIECTLKDPSKASSIESLLQQNDFRVFTVQCREDFKVLQEELNIKQRLHDVSFKTCTIDSPSKFQASLSPEEMQQYGLQGWAIDYLDGPAPVLAMLCMEKFLHQCALTDSDITQEQHDQLSALSAVKGYVSRNKSYQFIRRVEFGAAGVMAREKTLRRPEIWTNQPLDSGRKQQMEAESLELRGEIEEIKSQLQAWQVDFKSLGTEHANIEEEIKKLRNEKDERQKELAEYMALDTKIAQLQEKLTKIQQSLDTTRDRLAENKRDRDKAMFAKADIVLEYCTAVHKLREKTQTIVEVEIALVEAVNDFEVLSAHNDHIIQMLKQKEQERDQAAEVARIETDKAKGLMSQVKALRDEGVELERKGDAGLTQVLSELTSKEQPTESDLDDLIAVEKAKLELTDGGDMNTIKDFEERAKKIEQLRSRLTRMNNQQQELLDAIREVRERWEPPLDALVDKISDAFGESFARIGCAGQVRVYKASSDDPVDCTEDLGGSENGLDFANWAIHISVKFRENEPLSLLDSHRQSGGERAVSTIFYLMALQSLSRAPFRVVDEINQGMDPRNERMVHGRMVDIAAADEEGNRQGSQYFLITPKLLSGLKYKAGMTVLCIVSGENMPSAANTRVQDGNGKWTTQPGRTIDFAEFARKARALGLDRGAGDAVDQNIGSDRGRGRGTGTGAGAGAGPTNPISSFETVGRSSASVGA